MPRRRSGLRQARQRESAFARVQAIAIKRGGRCLSSRYERPEIKLRFRCANGHEWLANALLVNQGSWCALCEARRKADRAKEKKFRSVRAIAAKRGGRCLSETYVHSRAPLHWRCADGHEWDACAQSIGDGTWCPRCAGVARHTIEALRERARRRGGECLSEAYVNVATPMHWQCAQGHRWWSTASCVLQYGTWCPQCFGMPRGDLARMQRIARRHGGKCLSRRYRGASKPLLWRCRKGHEWRTRPTQIARGSWCPTCRRPSGGGTALTLENMKAMAAQRGGECLSRQYFNLEVPMRWRCARGHEWESTGQSLRNHGSWCPRCAHSVRGTIEALRARAAELGGRCLSSSYDGRTTPLLWECARGHRFEALAGAIKSGLWCLRCTKRPSKPREPPPKGTGQHRPPRRGARAAALKRRKQRASRPHSTA